MERIRCDLHLHTQASDGTWTPEEAVAAAQAAGLGLMAVTDHDRLNNVLATEKIARAKGVRFLRGVEICTTEGEKSFHVLGYGIDPASKAIQELCDHNDALLRRKDDDSVLRLAELGWPVSLEEYHAYHHDRSEGGFPSLGYLVHKGLCKDVNDFFARIFTLENGLDFPRFVPIREAVATIHAAGGLAFLAHPASHFHGPGLDDTLRMLAHERFDGFECHHSSHNEEDTAFLVDYCHKNNYLISGGSDCHGSFTAARKIGQPEIYLDELRLGGLI